MNSDPILNEIWRTKDRLAAEAGYSVEEFFKQLRAWADAHPSSGPLVANPEELRRLLQNKAEKSVDVDATVLKEEPPRYETEGGPEHDQGSH